MNRQEFKRLEGIAAEKAIAAERSENWVSPRATAECPVPVGPTGPALHRPPAPAGTPRWVIMPDVADTGESIAVRV